MSVNSSVPMSQSLTDARLRLLAGKTIEIDGNVYRFQEYHPRRPGWVAGREGAVYRLLDSDGSLAAYLKFFWQPTPKRTGRTQWLIGQRLSSWPNFEAAPGLWVDSRKLSGAPKMLFEFEGAFSRAVPGETWETLKERLAADSRLMDEKFRLRCAVDLIHSTAVLEEKGIVHGDLSPANIVVNLDAQAGQPALYLVDFDAFVAHSAGDDLKSLSIAEDDTCIYGTDGYCPPVLSERYAKGDTSVAPVTDVFARDMLILELLFMGPGFPHDRPPRKWNLNHLKRRADRTRPSYVELKKVLESCWSRFSGDRASGFMEPRSADLFLDLSYTATPLPLGPFHAPLVAATRRQLAEEVSNAKAASFAWEAMERDGVKAISGVRFSATKYLLTLRCTRCRREWNELSIFEGSIVGLPYCPFGCSKPSFSVERLWNMLFSKMPITGVGEVVHKRLAIPGYRSPCFSSKALELIRQYKPMLWPRLEAFRDD